MTAHQVHQRVEEGQGIVFPQAFSPAAEGIGVQRAGDKADGGFAQGIIHHAVQRIAQAVAALRAVGYLVACVLPYLAQQRRLRILRADGGAQIAQEAHGQLVRHIQPPAGCARAHPAARHAVLRQDEPAVVLVVLVDLGQGIHAPPALVFIRKTLKGEPPGIGGIGALIRAHAVVAAVAVKIQAVVARVVEHAVQQHAHAALGGLLAQAG